MDRCRVRAAAPVVLSHSGCAVAFQSFRRQNGVVLATIYPDTNAFFGDPMLRKQYSLDFLAALTPGVVEVGLSPVVLAEVKRQTEAKAASSASALKRAIRSVEHDWESNTAPAKKRVEKLSQKVLAEGGKPLAALLAHDANRVLDWTRVSARELVERELDKRRPTRLSGDQSTGLRDTVIWHTILEDLNLDDPHSIAILVTKDTGFLNAKKDGLHQDLIDDLEDMGVEASRIIFQPDLAGALIEAQKFTERISKREAAIREVFLDHLRGLADVSWFSQGDASGIWIDADTYPAEAPGYLEQGQVVNVDVDGIESIVDGEPASAVGYATVTFDGWMRSEEYMFGEYSDEVDRQDGDLDDPYVFVSAEKTVRVEASIDVDMETMDADVASAQYEWA